MKVALVYDRINKMGGAERVLEVLGEIFPQAYLYTAFYNPRAATWARKFKVVASWLNRFPFASSYHELFPWLTPLGFEAFDFSDFDLVISITSAEAKGIITRPETLHLCYCLTPTRYLWSGYKDYFGNKAIRFLANPFVGSLKKWDLIAAQRPDAYIAISSNIKKRIKKYYRRESTVIYPPVDLDKWRPSNDPQEENYFLVVSRLVKYKKIDLAIKAFNQLKLPLKIVGVGRELSKLKRLAKSNIKFLGQLTDRELLGYYQKSQAVIYPQEEDFGLVPLEAQACGTPVIAYQGGGALESVVEGKTGLFFSPQGVESLIEAIKKFKILKPRLEPEACRQNAEKFGKQAFKIKFQKLIEEKIRGI